MNHQSTEQRPRPAAPLTESAVVRIADAVLAARRCDQCGADRPWDGGTGWWPGAGVPGAYQMCPGCCAELRAEIDGARA